MREALIGTGLATAAAAVVAAWQAATAYRAGTPRSASRITSRPTPSSRSPDGPLRRHRRHVGGGGHRPVPRRSAGRQGQLLHRRTRRQPGSQCGLGWLFFAKRQLFSVGSGGCRTGCQQCRPGPPRPQTPTSSTGRRWRHTGVVHLRDGDVRRHLAAQPLTLWRSAGPQRPAGTLAAMVIRTMATVVALCRRGGRLPRQVGSDGRHREDLRPEGQLRQQFAVTEVPQPASTRSSSPARSCPKA